MNTELSINYFFPEFWLKSQNSKNIRESYQYSKEIES